MYPKNIAKKAVDACVSKKADQIKVLKMGKLSSLCDYLIIATSRSNVQTRVIIEAIYESLRKKVRLLHTEDAKGWTLIDYGSVIVNIFEEPYRTFYQLETLWADCEEVEIQNAKIYSTTKAQRHKEM